MKRAFQYVTHYGSVNQEFADANVRRYEQKGVLRAGVPSSSPQSPSPFSLPPYPLTPTPFDACYAGYVERWYGQDGCCPVCKSDDGREKYFSLKGVEDFAVIISKLDESI